jgi:phosphoribosylformimino-5-aminoimidazole carboxamide ribotide isomerase
VIAMTLDRVGSHAGPDLGRLRAIKDLAGRREVYAAGGVRDAADLRALQEASIAGALVATSLHNGRITSADLRAL